MKYENLTISLIITLKYKKYIKINILKCYFPAIQTKSRLPELQMVPRQCLPRVVHTWRFSGAWRGKLHVHC